MIRTLDIYIRAHAGCKSVRMTADSPRISFFAYYADGGTVSKESADNLIFQRVCKSLSPENRKEIESLTQSQGAIECLDEFLSNIWEYCSWQRKGRYLSYMKRVETDFPNYSIHWNDDSVITAIIACGSDCKLYCWIPEQKTDLELRLELRNLLDVAMFPKDVDQLVSGILDRRHFLGKVANEYNHVNVHWNTCRPKRREQNIKQGYLGFHDSRRLNELLIHEWRKRSPVVSRHNTI